MLNIEKTKDGDKLTVKVAGYMDTSNAAQLSEALEGELDEKDGRMVLLHVNDDIKEVLDLTGFSNFLEVEN